MSTWTWAFTVIGAILALWSVTWTVRASRADPKDRIAEQEARARVARGGGWDGAEAPRVIPDDVLDALALSQQPLTLEEAGVVAVPRTDDGPRRGRRRREKQ